MKIKSLILQVLVIGVVGVVMSGCASLKESFASQMEVPTLEKQANRVSIGMTIVRENNIMAFKMPISADATWPKEISADLDEKQEKHIAKLLQREPYFATVQYTEPIQRQMLGSSILLSGLGEYANVVGSILNQTISPLTYKAMQKLEAFYGSNPAKWPNVFESDNSLDNFLDFKGGELKVVEALNGDVYETLGEAVISLTPLSLQKDLSSSRLEMLEAYEKVASLQSQRGQIEGALNKALTLDEKLQMEGDLSVLDEQIEQAESVADENELIYFTLLDEAVIALESDINIDDENYVKLAKNINIVADEIQSGATQAYTSFALALTNIAANNILLQFPRELRSLAYAKSHVPSNLQASFDKRIQRLMTNAVYLLPNIFIGTYYAHKQSNLAEKYEAITEIIVLAYEVKVEQEKQAKEAAQKAAKELEDSEKSKV